MAIKEVFSEKNKKTKELAFVEREYGECTMNLREMIEFAKTSVKTLKLVNEAGKMKGEMHFRNCSLRNFYSFIDLHVKNGLNIVPVIAVDFSLANLTFDENQYCLHTLKPGAPNDYVDALRRVTAAFKNFSQFTLGYGVGARTV